MNVVAALVAFFLIVGAFARTASLAGFHRYRRAWLLLAVATLARAIIGVWVHKSGLLTLIGPDSIFYDQLGSAIAAEWDVNGVDPSWVWSKQRYARLTYLVATLYHVVGHETWVGVLAATLCGGLATVLIYLTTAENLGEPTGWVAGIIMSLLPSLVLWNSMILKEGPDLLAIVVCLRALLDLRVGARIWPFVWLALGIWFLTLTRPPFAALIGVMSFLIICSGFIRNLTQASPGRVATASVWSMVFMVLLLLVVAFRGAISEMISQNIHDAEVTRVALAVGTNTAYLGDVKNESLFDYIIFLPVGMIYFLLSPFPWEIGSKVSQLYIFDMITWYVIFWFSVAGLVGAARDRLNREFWNPVMLLYLPLIVLYSVATGNAGTAMRHRTEVMPVFVITAAAAIVKPWRVPSGAGLLPATAPSRVTRPSTFLIYRDELACGFLLS